MLILNRIDKTQVIMLLFNDILHMSFLAGTHVCKAYPAYTTTEIYESALNVVRFVRFQ